MQPHLMPCLLHLPRASLAKPTNLVFVIVLRVVLVSMWGDSEHEKSH